VPNASAQTEQGKTCTANAAAANWTLIGFNPARIYLPMLTELPTWVVTRWKVQVAPGKGPLAQQLVAFESVGEEEDRLIGESAVETVYEGTNEFATRIPAKGLGPHLGLRGPVETLYCTEKDTISGIVEGGFASGESRHYQVKIGVGTPLTATLEADRDGDGYGDLTQDGCLDQPALHEACPFVRLTPSVTAITRGAILLDVSTGSPTQVQVAGRVSWMPRSRSRSKRGAHPPQRRRVVDLDGGTMEVGTDATVSFAIPLPKALRQRLGRMTSRESLKGELNLTATDIVGHLTTRTLYVKLFGRSPHQIRTGPAQA
jgi:hypothetical protein